MTLARRLLNGETLERMQAICVPEEIAEVKAALTGGPVKLRRTFNQKWPDGSVTKYWRVIAPANHRNIDSDLSLAGLKEWGII